MPNTGIFVPAYIPFRSKTYEQQARDVIRKVQECYDDGYTKVGITYSANHDQTLKIRATYNAGKRDTGTGGSNQAGVMTEVERLLKEEFPHLQNVFYILPITTCKHSGGVGAVQQDWLVEDLNAVESFASKPKHAVLAWQNESSGKNSYAVGGAISTQLEALVPGERNKTQNQFIQEKLKKYEQQYPDSRAKKNLESKSSSQMIEKMEASTVASHMKGKHTGPITSSFTPEKKEPTPSLETKVKKEATTPLANDNPEVTKASKTLVQEIKQKETNLSSEADFIIHKGNINGTFKIGFTTAGDAQQFFEHLNELSKTLDFGRVTYFPEKEKYPMDSHGNVTAEGTYKHIVRFEVPEDALKYLENIHVSNSENLYHSIMATEQPANIHSLGH